MGFAKLSLKGRALKLLGQREHSRLELERKLAPHVEEGEDLGAMLDALEQRGFISAQRVAESVLHRKAARFGTARVVQELRSKGLDDGLVRAAAERARAAARLLAGPDHSPATWALPAGDLARPIHGAAEAVAGLLTDPVPVRACGGQGCGWLFADPHDRRRWCTMAICGNRAKAARHARRHRTPA